jgi:hypothetical protein
MGRRGPTDGALTDLRADESRPGVVDTDLLISAMLPPSGRIAEAQNADRRTAGAPDRTGSSPRPRYG